MSRRVGQEIRSFESHTGLAGSRGLASFSLLGSLFLRHIVYDEIRIKGLVVHSLQRQEVVLLQKQFTE